MVATEFPFKLALFRSGCLVARTKGITLKPHLGSKIQRLNNNPLFSSSVSWQSGPLSTVWFFWAHSVSVVSCWLVGGWMRQGASSGPTCPSQGYLLSWVFFPFVFPILRFKACQKCFLYLETFIITIVLLLSRKLQCTFPKIFMTKHSIM